MELSVIITHYKTPGLLDLCIESIKAHIRNIKYEIIVVDSNSEETTQDFLKENYPEVTIIPFKKNVGYSKVVNAGLIRAKGNYILLLNADIVVLEKSVSEMLEYIREHPHVGIVGPRLLDFVGNIQSSCFSFPKLRTILARRTSFGKTSFGKRILSEFITNSFTADSPIKTDWLQGSAMMVRKKAVQKVGLWDERFFMYFEDTDWCRRFWKSGYEVIYLPAAKMAHYYHRASKKWGALLDIFLNKRARIHIVSAIKYFWKYRHDN